MIKIGILTSGGDAPGMNAAIRACVRSSLSLGIEVYGVFDGYEGLVNNNIRQLDRGDVSDIIIQGGTVLGSARLEEFKLESIRQQAVDNLHAHGIQGLVVIGGDGSYRGAQALSAMGINCIGIPATIDNDIDSTDYSIGFDTALNTVIQNVDKLRDTSSSHHRCSIVEVMGNRCGDLALYSGISTGAEMIITPETGYDYEWTINRLQELDQIRHERHAIVVISEKLTDVEDLAKNISRKTSFAGRSTVLGYIQRGGSPTASDRLLATRMGDHAVSSLIEGKYNHAVGIMAGQLVSIPIKEAFLLEKEVKQDMFDLQKRLV